LSEFKKPGPPFRRPGSFLLLKSSYAHPTGSGNPLRFISSQNLVHLVL
jgi:hypothetical protein